ncbi:hypothetical protein F4815DRAFT_481568 [Daldinia loculata]|nr:hypothetical protein F4815DRAFT_481568 [Daldinia loculata]
MAMTAGLFTEPDPTHIAHSPLSLRFATDALLRDWAIFITKYGEPATQAMTEATEKWGDSKALDETAWNVFGGTTKPFFEYLKDVPGMVDLFSRYMQSQGLSEGMRLEHVLDGFDWAKLDANAQIIDVSPLMIRNRASLMTILLIGWRIKRIRIRGSRKVLSRIQIHSPGPPRGR